MLIFPGLIYIITSACIETSLSGRRSDGLGLEAWRHSTDNQLTAGLSIFNRITGVGLSGLLYVGSLVYLFHPMYPALDSAHLVQLVADLPTWFKGSVKLALAGAFTLHSYNGIRHLMWDMGRGESS
jgi:succinate dehydrogenase cytochrome b556 subunit